MAREPYATGDRKYQTTLTQILAQGVRSGEVPARMKSSREWFRKRAEEMTHVTARRILREEEKERFFEGLPEIGKMFLYIYDPKWKNDPIVLPYYDHYPLVVPFDYKSGKTKDGRPCMGFLGINFHYLPLPARAKFMDALYPKTVKQSGKFTPEAYLNINYGILKGLAGMAKKYFKPAIKHYLMPHLRSRRMLIYPVEWDIALFLPLAQWTGATQKQVWEDAEKIFQGLTPHHAENIRRRARGR